MGIVYLAHDPVIDREVALKTLRLDLDSGKSEEFRERFVREARAAGRLNHPSIVTIHDVGEDPANGLLFIAMERIEGQNLKELMSSGTRFDPDEAARIVASVAQALDYAHTLGVVHRDIKPANIILTPDGIPKITDFGVAHLESSDLTVEGQFIGTPNYMSPEQIAGRALDGRSDIFSLGVVFYELLVGRRPFSGPTIVDLGRRIAEEQPPIPSQADPRIPPAFNPIVLRCLEKSPERRFETAGQLSETLRALLRVRGHEPAPEPRSGTYAGTAAEIEAAGPRVISLERITTWWREFPLPPVLRREVTTRWVAGILLAWTAAWALTFVVLQHRVDHGPFPAPPASQIRTIHRLGTTLREAGRALDAGNFETALTKARAVLDQAPASPAARAIIAAASTRSFQQRQSEKNRKKVEALIAEGRKLFHRSRYRSAASRFEKALELDPENDLAQSFLELARARSGSGIRRPRSTKGPGSTRGAAPTTAPRTAEKPSTAKLTISFDSPLNAGLILATMDGKTLAQIPFDFTKKGFLGIKHRGTGLVRRSLLLPSGRHTLGIQLNDDERGPLGFSSFSRHFPGDSRWTLRIDLPDAKGTPSFYLVQAGR